MSNALDSDSQSMDEYWNTYNSHGMGPVAYSGGDYNTYLNMVAGQNLYLNPSQGTELVSPFLPSEQCIAFEGPGNLSMEYISSTQSTTFEGFGFSTANISSTVSNSFDDYDAFSTAPIEAFCGEEIFLDPYVPRDSTMLEHTVQEQQNFITETTKDTPNPNILQGSEWLEGDNNLSNPRVAQKVSDTWTLYNSFARNWEAQPPGSDILPKGDTSLAHRKVSDSTQVSQPQLCKPRKSRKKSALATITKNDRSKPVMLGKITPIPGYPGASWKVTGPGKGAVTVQDDSHKYEHGRASIEGDASDFTSFVPRQKYYSAKNLPRRLGLIHNRESITVDWLFDSEGSVVCNAWGKMMRNIPFLPLRISDAIEEWLVAYWFSKGAELSDIVGRMVPRINGSNEDLEKVWQAAKSRKSVSNSRWRARNGAIWCARTEQTGMALAHVGQIKESIMDGHIHPFQLMCRTSWSLDKLLDKDSGKVVLKMHNGVVHYKAPEPRELDPVVRRALMELRFRIPTLRDLECLETWYNNKVNPYLVEEQGWVDVDPGIDLPKLKVIRGRCEAKKSSVMKDNVTEAKNGNGVDRPPLRNHTETPTTSQEKLSASIKGLHTERRRKRERFSEHQPSERVTTELQSSSDCEATRASRFECLVAGKRQREEEEEDVPSEANEEENLRVKRRKTAPTSLFGEHSISQGEETVRLLEDFESQQLLSSFADPLSSTRNRHVFSSTILLPSSLDLPNSITPTPNRLDVFGNNMKSSEIYIDTTSDRGNGFSQGYGATYGVEESLIPENFPPTEELMESLDPRLTLSSLSGSSCWQILPELEEKQAAINGSYSQTLSLHDGNQQRGMKRKADPQPETLTASKQNSNKRQKTMSPGGFTVHHSPKSKRPKDPRDFLRQLGHLRPPGESEETQHNVPLARSALEDCIPTGSALVHPHRDPFLFEETTLKRWPLIQTRKCIHHIHRTVGGNRACSGCGTCRHCGRAKLTGIEQTILWCSKCGNNHKALPE